MKLVFYKEHYGDESAVLTFLIGHLGDFLFGKTLGDFNNWYTFIEETSDSELWKDRFHDVGPNTIFMESTYKWN